MASNLLQRKRPVCGESHSIRLCLDFMRLTVSMRLADLRKHKCCTNCLAASHEFKRCQSSNVCYICNKSMIRYFIVPDLQPGRNRGPDLSPLTLLPLMMALRKSLRLLLPKSEMMWIMAHPLLLDLFRISPLKYSPPPSRQFY